MQEQPRKKREFGDHMAPEAETSHIPHIVCAMYGLILGYSYLASLVTGDPWYAQCLFYFVVLVLFYIWHWMAHQKWTGRMYKIHMEHHLKSFPPSIFYGRPGTVKEVYGKEVPTLWDLMDPRRSTNFTFAHEGPLYVMLGITLTVARVVLGCSWATLGFFTFMSVIMGVVGSALHSSFHVKDFQLEQFQWYRELRTLHYLHHLGNMQHNYAVFNLGLDYFFQSLVLLDPVGSKKEKERDAWESLIESIEKKQEELPKGVTLRQLQLARQSAGALSSSLFAAIPTELKRGYRGGSAVKRGYPTVLLRILIIGLAAWFWWTGASLLFSHLDPSHPIHTIQVKSDISADGIYDAGHQLLLPLRNFLLKSAKTGSNPTLLPFLVDAKLALSDVLCITLALLSLLGPTFRPALGGIFALVLRVFAQFMTRFVAEPSEMYRGDGMGYPYIFGTASTSGSFISPHVLVATVFLIESVRFMRTVRNSPSHNTLKKVLVGFWQLLAVSALVLQVVIALALQTNWTFDLLVSVLLASYTSMVAARYTVFIDALLP